MKEKIYIVKEHICSGESEFTAAGKARIDVEDILYDWKAKDIKIKIKKNSNENSILKKLFSHYHLYQIWKKSLDKLKEGDVLIIQFPLQEGFIFASHLLKNLKKKNIKTIAVIHDLETLRITKDNTISKKRKIRLYIEEIPTLKQFSKIVVHNQSMKKVLMKKGISEDSMVTLKMFDYLIKEGNALPGNTKSKENNIIIAGNLSSYKVGYVYELPHDVKFDLYGINYTGVTDNKIKYHGSYPSDELPWHLKGAYGLVWDGDTAKTCSGIFGDYLRINNPHKTSLYLACGIPIITWNKAAIAQYVRKNRVGITVSSLDEINEKLKDVSKDEYNLMRKNAKKCSERVRKGYYLKKAIQEALS